MRHKFFLLILVLVFLFQANDISGQKVQLPERFKKWLEEEVVYIISPIEKEVFSKLTTDRERDLFIEAFWKQRDPTPGTSENEFKNEHFRRINYTNHFFGRTSPKPGWKTDQGRIYIILGEPNDIQRFDGKTQTYPAEIWFYQGKTDLGLPPGFNLVFFQQGGTGEFRLYSPARDGPQALLTSYYGDPIDYAAAYEALREHEPSLADVSLSLIPGEDSVHLGRPSLASDLLVQRVETVPRRLIEEKYAQKFLQYKDIVEVEYSANYMDSSELVKVLRDPSGLYFVHLAIEPERLSVGQYEKKFYSTLLVNGTVATMEGKTIYQFERTISLDFDEEQMQSISRQPLNIHDMFPLIPGTYRMSVLIKNEVSKEFTSIEQTLVIPQEEAGARMSSLILGHKVTRVAPTEKRLKPFLLGSYQVYSQPGRIFLKKDTLALAFQLYGLTESQEKNGELRFTFQKNGEDYRTTSRGISDFPDVPQIVEEFPLADFPPAHYIIKAALLVGGREIFSASDEFDVSHVEAMARPWVYSKILPEASDPMFAYLIGTQLFNSGRLDEAQASLERAFHGRPDSADFALNLSLLYMAKAEYKEIETILKPFFSQDQAPKYELYFLMGRAYQKMGDLSKAIGLFDKAISHYGINASLLNSIGECYFQLGEYEAALASWEKSLELSPDQPEIRKNVEALKEKK